MCKKKNENVQVLRAVLSMVVIMGHIYGLSIYKMDTLLWNVIRPFFDGNTAVLAFFILSGYFMTGKLDDKVENVKELILFSMHRLARLLPLAWLSILFGFILCNFVINHDNISVAHISEWGLGYWQRKFTFAELLMEMRMIKVNPGSNGLINPPIWTVMKEVKYAVVFPILIFGQHKVVGAMKARYSGAFVSIVMTALIYLVYSKSGKLDFLYVFCIGGGIAEVRKCFLASATKEISYIKYIEILAVGFAFYYIEPLICVTIITGCCLLLSPKKSNQSVGLNGMKKVFIWLGNISFEVYLVHFPILLALRSTVKSETIACFTVYVIISLGLVLIMAYILNWIDKRRNSKILRI